MTHRTIASDTLLGGLLAGAAGFLLGRWSAIDGHTVPCHDDEDETLELTIGNQVHPELPMATISKEFVIGDGPAAFKVRPTHRGQVEPIDGPVTVEIVETSLFSATVQPDGLTVLFEDRGVPGTTEATISADVKAGPEVLTKTVLVGLVAVPAMADTLEGDFGDQTPATPAPTPTPTPTPPTPPTEPPPVTPPTPAP